MPQDFKKDIDWIISAYELAGVTFSDGFQKDAIQNAVGARGKDSWNDWSCKINVINTSKGQFIVIEDEGTEGLTGPNLLSSEIVNMIDNDEEIDATWRLARFSSRNVSGGNQMGPGKYGVGKSVYSACSSTYDYCFDSLRADGKYVANRNEAGQIFEKALEGEDAKSYIKSVTGLSEKYTVGTRIIIINPREDICESINSGEIISFIQESWWRCINKMPAECGIFINDKRVNSPEMPQFENSYELPKPEMYAPGYRVKRFAFNIEPRGTVSKWHGVSYYRRGMKIGTVDIQDIPSTIKDRFWGYIEVDKEWEELLSGIEDAIHYGVIPAKKRTIIYQNMKLFIANKVSQLLVDWGYVKDKDHEDKKLQEALKELSAEVQELFDSMGFEDLGKGTSKPDYSVRLKDIQYPNPDSLTVSTNDTISFGFRITNEYLTNRKFDYSVEVISKANGKKMCTLAENTINLNSGESHDDHIDFVVSMENAERFEENRIVVKVYVRGGKKEKSKELPFFYDTEKEDNSHREVILSLHSMDWPHENSRRVNFGEELKNIVYTVENKRSFPLSFSLNISVHNCEDPNNAKIMDIIRIKGEASPYEEVVLSDIPDVVFEKDKLEEYIDAGVVELRARLVATEDSDEFEKGDKITHYYQKIYLNSDENKGKDSSFEPKTDNQPENFRRSWCKGGSRTIIINSGHPAYIASQDDEINWKSYLKQEMLKQYVLLYLEEGKYGVFGEGIDITTMDPIDASKCIMDKIEEVYQNSFKK